MFMGIGEKPYVEKPRRRKSIDVEKLPEVGSGPKGTPGKWPSVTRRSISVNGVG
jgi:hypothetical protein